MTNINIKDIPQANSLVKVLETAIAVSKGARSFQEISEHIQLSDRQGRYYRRAAEILGLIKINGINNSILTENGERVLHAINFDSSKVEILKPIIIQLPLINEVMSEFDGEQSVTDNQILSKLIEIGGWDHESETGKRRLSTFVNWLREVEILTGVKDSRETKYKINTNLKKKQPPALKIIDPYNDFIKKVQAYLEVPYESNLAIETKDLLHELLSLENPEQVKTWLEKDGADAIARLILFISEKEEINIEKVFKEKENFKTLELSHERLLIEVDRTLKGLSQNIGKGGSALENLVIDFCNKHQLEWKRSHLFIGLSKNVDFYIPSMNLAIECKYSKTSGTKHAGALKDIREQARGKSENNYKLAVLIGGNQFHEDKELRSALEALIQDQTLNFIFTPKDMALLSPSDLVTKVDFNFIKSDLEINILDESSWEKEISLYESGIDDAAKWLKRFLSVEYLNFYSQLHTWINQTPFATQCLRLILGWSESQMSSFIKKIFNENPVDWKYMLTKFSDANILVHQLSENLPAEDIMAVQNFFQQPISYLDFIIVREKALRGSAVRKLNTSKVFVNQCRSNSSFLVIDQKESCLLPSGAKIESNFQIQIEEKKINVLCKYYSTSGSVMSDLVKSIAELVEINKAHEWVFIVDGPGWLERDKDLKRLISLVTSNKLQFYNYENWSQVVKKASNS